MKAIDARLEPRFRGRSGYRKLVEQTTLRVSVTGIRGKSALTKVTANTLRERGLSVYAKITGTDPISVKDGVEVPIERDPRKKAILDETYAEVKKHWPFDAMVLENQAVTPYTMRVFNKLYCRPHYLLVTNIRRDHMGDLGRTVPQMAEAFARSAPTGCTLVNGERDPSIKKVLRKVCDARGVRFLDAAPDRHVVPGYETVTILDAMLIDWMGEGLTRTERREARRALERNFRWRDSVFPGVSWFHGAEINDVDSTRIVLEHLRREKDMPVTFIAYLRRDRIDRTASFIPFLADQLQQGVASHIILCGPKARHVQKRLDRWRDQVHVLPDKEASAPKAARFVEKHCRGEGVMTIINAVPPWPRAVARMIGDEGVPTKNDPDNRLLAALGLRSGVGA